MDDQLAKPRPLSRIQLRNKSRILDSALDVFASRGFHGATIDQIADGAGMSKANVLYYFRRKREIHAAVLARTLELWLEPLDRIDSEGDPVEEIWQYARAKLVLSRESPQASRVFANEVLQGAETLQGYVMTNAFDVVERKCQIVREWIDAGRLAPVDPVHLILMIWAITQHYADFYPQVRVLIPSDEATIYAGAEETLRLLVTRGLSVSAADPV